MSDIEYHVAAILELSGGDKAARSLSEVAASADRANARMAKLGALGSDALGSVGSAIGGAIDSFARLGATAAAVGGGLAAAVGFAALKVGIVDVNAKLEETQLGFATLFSMLGGESFESGLGIGKGLMADIRKDAAALPGEFGDFVQMAQTITAPLLNAGKGVQDIRNMTRETVVASAALGVNFQQGSREMAMLLEGHAGGHNVLGTRLGITAHTQAGGKEWNQASTEDRFAYLDTLLKKADVALPAFQRSWVGLTSTLIDTGKASLGAATAPLFERMKSSMWEIAGTGGFLEKHEAQVHKIERAVSDGLVKAYDWAADGVKKIPGIIEKIGDNWAYVRAELSFFLGDVRHAYHELEPLLMRLFSMGETALKHPTEALEKLIALRVAAGAMQAAPSLFKAGSWLSEMGGSTAGASASGAAAVGAGASTGGVSGGAAGATEALTGVATAAGAVGLALVAAAGAVDVLTIDTSKTTGAVQAFGEMGQGVSADIRTNFNATWASLETIGTAARPLADALGVALLGAVDGATLALRGLAGAAAWLLGGVGGTGAKSAQDAAAQSLAQVSRVLDYHDKQVSGAFDMAFGGRANPIDGVTPREIKKNFDNLAPEEKRKHEPAQNIDMRGSKITIQIDAKDHDPDRLIRRMNFAMGRAISRQSMGSTPVVARAF